MVGGVRCICGTKLAEMLEGRLVIRCRKCERTIVFNGTSSITVLDRIPAGAVAFPQQGIPVTTK